MLFIHVATFDDPLQALEFAQAKVESLVAYCAESNEEGKIGQCFNLHVHVVCQLFIVY